MNKVFKISIFTLTELGHRTSTILSSFSSSVFVFRCFSTPPHPSCSHIHILSRHLLPKFILTSEYISHILLSTCISTRYFSFLWQEDCIHEALPETIFYTFNNQSKPIQTCLKQPDKTEVKMSFESSYLLNICIRLSSN